MRILVLPLLLAGCPAYDTKSSDSGGDSPGATCDTAGTALPAACACDDATVTIGTGDVSYVPVAAGAEVTMTHGPQGGWHVLGSAEMANLLPIVSIHYTITTQPEGAIVSDNLYRVQMVAEGECGGYYPGMFGYLDVTALATGDLDTPPELLAGHTLRLAMEVTDTEARTATAQLDVVAALDPMDEPTDTGTP
jgi:hypothetical protein